MRIDLPDFVNPSKKSTTISGEEFKILGLAAMGYADSRISTELGVSRPGIANIWRRILSKFGASVRPVAPANGSEGMIAKQVTASDSQIDEVPANDATRIDSENREQDQDKLLLAISDASVSYINGRQNVRQVYSRMLDDLLALTQSHYGLVAEIHYENGIAVLGEYALTCSGWDAAAQAKYEGTHQHQLSFQLIDPLFAEPGRTKELVISNNKVGAEVGRPRTPEGHPIVLTFMGIPVYSGLEVVGVIGLANRRDGYSHQIADSLRPIVSTCANITVAWRLEASRRTMQRELDSATCLMRTMVDRAPSAVMFETTDRRLEFINNRFGTLFGLEAAPNQVVGLETALVIKHSKGLFCNPGKFIDRVEDLIEGQESCYGERILMANGREYLRDFVVVRSGLTVCGYFWQYRESSALSDD